ncbi:MAG: MFS transporter [Planctomycetota bacterium]
MIHQWFPGSQRSLANGIATGAAPLGIALTYVLFAASSNWSGWRFAFVVNGSVSLALTLLWLTYAKDDPRGHPGVNQRELELIAYSGVSQRAISDEKRPVENATPWSQFLRNRGLMLITASYVSIGYFQYLLFYWIETYFRDKAKFSASQSQYFSTIATLSMVITMPLGGWVADKLSVRFGRGLSRKVVVMGGMTAASGFLLLAIQTQSALPMVICFSLSLGSLGLAEGPFWTTAVELGGKMGGTSAAIFNTGGNVGGIVAPYLSPWLGENYGWNVSMGVGSLICLLGVVFWIWISPPAEDSASNN